jgi:hypothetical protein
VHTAIENKPKGARKAKRYKGPVYQDVRIRPSDLLRCAMRGDLSDFAFMRLPSRQGLCLVVGFRFRCQPRLWLGDIQPYSRDLESVLSSISAAVAP